MANRNYVANDLDVPRATLTRLFHDTVQRLGDASALRYFVSEGAVRDLSYRRVWGLVRQVCGGLAALGMKRGDRAALLSENRPEWALADYGCLWAGVVDVPVYSTLTAVQVAYVLNDSGARLVFASTPDQMRKALEAAAACEQRIEVVVFDPPDELPEGVISWRTFLERGAETAAGWSEEEFLGQGLQAEPDDVATILYTSGTTGDPKGVMLTHDNVAFNVQASGMVLEIGPTDRTLSFLPTSHILQRMVDYLFFGCGCTIAYPRSVETIVEDMRVVQPTIVVSVPRLYEKIYNGLMESRGIKKLVIRWACDVARRSGTVRLSGGQLHGLLALEHALADHLVFTKVRASVGGCTRFFVSGGAPLSPALNRFFYSIGMTILEGYGLTETSPVTNVNSFERFRIGTVGYPVPGTEIRTAEDGEILVRGRQVMKGYYRDPEATAEVIDAEGWFHTGDVGELDEDGFLRVTDRKKDIIVTAGGKNVVPQPIENRIRSSPFVEEVVMVGDRRRFVALLVLPAFANLERWARERHLEFEDREDLLRHPDVHAHLEGEVRGRWGPLASFETPKRLVFLTEDFTVQNGLVTPTLKVRRRHIEKHYRTVIDAMYGDEASDLVVGER